MPPEDTTNTGADTAAATDTSNTGDDDAGAGDDEAGTATAEEIAAALGPKYKTVAPVADDNKEDEDAGDNKGDADEEAQAKADAIEAAKAEKEAKKSAKAESKKVATAAGTNDDTPDFSFTVDDANDVTYKIEPGDSIEDILKDFEPKNNGQIIAVLEQLREAKDAKAKYESDQAEEASKAAKAEQITSIQDGWNDEIKELQASKRIPTNAAGADNDRVAEVYKFMAEENDKRIAAKRPTLNSFEDALDKLENKEARDAKVEADKTAKDTARQNGSLVGGSSSAASASVPVYKAGSAKNPTQALKSMGIL